LTLVIVDDLDRAGDAEVARVAAWVRASRSRPVLTVVTATEPEALRDFEEDPRLDLAPLTDRAVADVISLYGPGAAVVDPAVRSGGIPRQVHEAAQERATAEVARRLDHAVAESAESRLRMSTARDDIVGGVLDLGRVRAASHARAAAGRDLVDQSVFLQFGDGSRTMEELIGEARLTPR
jgi:hypothetical protein